VNFFQRNKKNILRAFVELLVIFAGITISLLIDDWRQQNADEELALNYLKALYSDVTEDLAKINNKGRDQQQKLSDNDKLLKAIHFPDSIKISEEDFRNKFGNITKLDKFVSSDNTFRDLTGTGNIKLITDIQLKSSIYSYYKAIEELDELEQLNNDASAKLIVDVITNSFSVRSVYRFNSIFEGIEDLQALDLSFFLDINSEKYLELEDLLLFRHIFLQMEFRKLVEIYEPSSELRNKLCEITGIPSIDNFTKKLETSNLSGIELYENLKKEFPELRFIEGELNNNAYLAMEEGKMDLALLLLLLTKELYPESANVYDSLGEFYFRQKDFENSKINYQRSLEINPDNESAMEYLKQIEDKQK